MASEETAVPDSSTLDEPVSPPIWGTTAPPLCSSAWPNFEIIMFKVEKVFKGSLNWIP